MLVAGEEAEAGKFDYAEFGRFVFTQEGAKCMGGDIFAASDGDMRVERAQFWIEAGGEECIMEVFVEGEQVGVCGADAGPDDGWGSAAEGADALDGEMEWGDVHFLKLFVQVGFQCVGGISDEGESEVELVGVQPADASDGWAKLCKGFAAWFGQFEGDEQSFGYWKRFQNSVRRFQPCKRGDNVCVFGVS